MSLFITLHTNCRISEINSDNCFRLW